MVTGSPAKPVFISSYKSVKSAPSCETFNVLTILSPPGSCVKITDPVLLFVSKFSVTEIGLLQNKFKEKIGPHSNYILTYTHLCPQLSKQTQIPL